MVATMIALWGTALSSGALLNISRSLPSFRLVPEVPPFRVARRAAKSFSLTGKMENQFTPRLDSDM